MSNWFHRNPLKSTTSIQFDIPMVIAKANSVEICSNLKKLRNELIEYFQNPLAPLDAIEKTFNTYLSLLLGLIDDDNRGQKISSNEMQNNLNNQDHLNYIPKKISTDQSNVYNDIRNKLRYSIKFKWSQSLLGNVPLVYQDAVFELISICQEFSIWLMKNASALASNPEINEDQAKIVFKNLRKAAGLFKFVQTKYFEKLQDQPLKGSDLDPRVSNAYQLQCLAEAQEVTIARAIELKHSPSLISGLCVETSKLFYTACLSLKDLDSEKVGKYSKYLNLKSTFYEAYAYCYHAENLLEEEKAGESIKSMQECEKNIELLRKLCKEYVKAKGFGSSLRIDQHPVFYRLLTISKRIKDKCDRENSLIFHQKIPIEGITLYSKATHGLVTSEEFIVPNLDSRWTNEAYQAFDFNKSKDSKKEKDKSKKEQKPLPEMKEQEIKFDPNRKNKTESQCVIN